MILDKRFKYQTIACATLLTAFAGLYIHRKFNHTISAKPTGIVAAVSQDVPEQKPVFSSPQAPHNVKIIVNQPTGTTAESTVSGNNGSSQVRTQEPQYLFDFSINSVLNINGPTFKFDYNNSAETKTTPIFNAYPSMFINYFDLDSSQNHFNDFSKRHPLLENWNNLDSKFYK